ncbi:hypothetical protein A5714_03180 [Mycobacterium sp. E2462]|uniref:DUF3375 family protein n=1 Tax=Mycobacterium sp. E2462 TaxID=1834133 RepID=UPI0007FB8A42|nr:DUF3375 family protein [Mycobacterium sp. E2462]OBI04380.1 hypothetical protein A5714_03180 [Mycobacterium sp. E2462]
MTDRNGGHVLDDDTTLSPADLLELNRGLQGSPTIRLLAALNLNLYATLMERQLSGGVVPETDLVVRLERDLAALDPAGEQSGLALIKSWASQGWLHRVADQRSGIERNLCYLTQEARRALDFLRGMRRQDTIATGGSINGIAARLKQVALRVGNDPCRVRAGIEAEICALQAELDALDDAGRPDDHDVDLTDAYDEAHAIALQMERLITDIGQYGTMIERATAALDEPIDSNVEYRDRQRRMYADYEAAWDSQGRDSHRAFLRMINDPDHRAEFEADVAAVAEALPALDPALRKVMAGFFELVGHQIDEVERIQQRCAQRIKRFTAFGTLEQSRGVARQLNEAIGAARNLLKSSLTDSRLDIELPLARHAFTSVGALSFRIGDLSNPKPAHAAEGEVDLTSFAALTTQVDAPAMSEMINTAIGSGAAVSLPDAVAMLESAYLGHIIVLWSWALKQPDSGTVPGSATVRFRSLDGRDREMEVPRLLFTEPVSTPQGASA